MATLMSASEFLEGDEGTVLSFGNLLPLLLLFFELVSGDLFAVEDDLRVLLSCLLFHDDLVDLLLELPAFLGPLGPALQVVDETYPVGVWIVFDGFTVRIEAHELSVAFEHGV